LKLDSPSLLNFRPITAAKKCFLEL